MHLAGELKAFVRCLYGENIIFVFVCQYRTMKYDVCNRRLMGQYGRGCLNFPRMCHVLKKYQVSRTWYLLASAKIGSLPYLCSDHSEDIRWYVISFSVLYAGRVSATLALLIKYRLNNHPY